KPAEPYVPTTEAEKEISKQAAKGDTLAAIEHLEALLAARRPAEALPAEGAGASASTIAEPTVPAEPIAPAEPVAPAEAVAPAEVVEPAEPGATTGASAGIPEPGSPELDADVGDDADDVSGDDMGLTPISSPRVRAGEGVLTVGEPTPLPIFSIEQAGGEPTPREYRVGRASRLFWLWFAAGASVLVLGVGAALVAVGLNFVQVLIAALLGVALSFIPLGLSALTGVWSGQPTVVVSRATFGIVGNVIPAILILVVRLFWGAALLWLLAVAVADCAVEAGWASDRTVVLLSSFAIAAVVSVVVAIFGYALVAVIQLIATIATAALAVAIIVVAWPRSGWDRLASAPYGEWVLVVEGAVLVFSILGLAWASAGGDLARYQRAGSSGTAAALWSGFGASLPMLVLVVFGAILTITGSVAAGGFAADPVRALVANTPTWFAVPLVAAIAIGLMSALIVSLYSGGFAVQAIGVRLPRWSSVLVLGVLIAAGTAWLLAAVPGVSTLVLAYPTTLAVPVAAWTGIFLGDFLLRRRRIATDSLLHRGGVYPDWRLTNVIGLVVISAIGLGFMRADADGLRWEGYFFRALDVDAHGALAASDLGVLIALFLGLLLALLSGRGAVRRQENASR
ncbi:MAG: purine-cytosine permease family protein, partial [Humibacter sp.]